MKKFLIIILSIIFANCNQAENTPEELSSNFSGDTIQLSTLQIKNAQIETGEVFEKLISEEVSLTGTINLSPQNIVTVSFPLGGYLKETKLLPGMKVNKNEVIAIIEHEDLIQLQESYLISKIELSTLDKNLERQKTLNQSKISSDKILQETEEKFNTQKVRVKSIEEKLRLIGINPEKLNYDNISRSVYLRAPISGFVSKVNFNTGRYLEPADEIFELINPSDLHVTLTAFEKDLGKIKLGNKAKLTAGNNKEESFIGEVKMITPNMSENRSTTIICNINAASAELMPGMFVNGIIYTNPQDRVLINEEAIVRKADENFIIESVSDSLFVPVPVTLGVREGGLIAITPIRNENLEGRKFITKNPFRVFSMLNMEE